MKIGNFAAIATEILRGLIDEISLTPENGALRIDLKGELVSKKLAPDNGELEQIKVVAPACNHRQFPIRVAV